MDAIVKFLPNVMKKHRNLLLYLTIVSTSTLLGFMIFSHELCAEFDSEENMLNEDIFLNIVLW